MTASSDTCCGDDADGRCSALAHAITTGNALAAAPHAGRRPNPYRPSGLGCPRVVSTTAAPRRLGIRSTMCCPICQADNAHGVFRFSRNGGDGSARGDAVSGIRSDQPCEHEVRLALQKHAMPMSPLAPISSAVADRRSATDAQPRWQEPTYVEGADSGDWGRRRRLQFTDRLELPSCSCPV
jgi:hypothetical protein